MVEVGLQVRPGFAGVVETVILHTQIDVLVGERDVIAGVEFEFGGGVVGFVPGDFAGIEAAGKAAAAEIEFLFRGQHFGGVLAAGFQAERHGGVRERGKQRLHAAGRAVDLPEIRHLIGAAGDAGGAMVGRGAENRQAVRFLRVKNVQRVARVAGPKILPGVLAGETNHPQTVG